MKSSFKSTEEINIIAYEIYKNYDLLNTMKILAYLEIWG